MTTSKKQNILFISVLTIIGLALVVLAFLIAMGEPKENTIMYCTCNKDLLCECRVRGDKVTVDKIKELNLIEYNSNVSRLNQTKPENN